MSACAPSRARLDSEPSKSVLSSSTGFGSLARSRAAALEIGVSGGFS